MSAFNDDLLALVPNLRAFARSLTRNHSAADDLVQETLLKAISNKDKFREGTNLRAWLFTIMRNTFYSAQTKRAREAEDPEGDLTASLSVKPDHDGRLQYAEFQRAFAQLSDERREALTLIGALGLSYEEAAQTCGVAIGTMKSRVGRARAELATLLKLGDDGMMQMTDARTSDVVSNNSQAL